MASNVINRYIWLLNTLLQQKRVSFREISEAWQHSYLGDNKPLARRTFHLHKNAIEDMFNVVIRYDSSSNHYYIESPEKFRASRACQWLYDSLSVANIIQAGANMEERILFENIPGGTEYIGDVVRAMQQNRILLISYQQFGGEPKTLHFCPYAMKIYNRRWYIAGCTRAKKHIINISLDRIRTIEITDDCFSLPEDFDAKTYYDGSVGIYVNPEQKPLFVELRAYGIQRDYLRTLPLHHSQEEYATTSEYSDFRYYIRLSPELTTQILAMGDSVEVLEPQELRERIKDRATKIANMYK